MKQIVLDYSCLFDDDIIIDDVGIYHYLVNVRRLRVGDSLNVLLGRREVRFVEVVSIKNNQIRLSTLRVEELQMCRFEISMFISNLKGRKLDLSLRQIVEIGVSQINIVNADNSIARLDIDNLEFKSSRFLKIIDEALKQSGNTQIPNVNFYNDFFSIPYSSSVNYYVAHSKGDLLRCGDNISAFGKIGILIGPEGCFSNAEIDFFKKMNFRFVRFNTSILRADTAIVYSLAHFKLLLEGSNG
ncbi:16S rRNA (uracil(1498)-N(3))-methyltransferase [Borrelia persica]|uniref:16S rRNA (uracil(1498)-N(3))-methyltransferase n=1 Tax=Borrelia persica TaxID=44448 RepID=UPI00046445BB|nr:16S rRNA (uracil(1498)-N(3))-methyltransferase [Borrelia persica]